MLLDPNLEVKYCKHCLYRERWRIDRERYLFLFFLNLPLLGIIIYIIY